MSLPRSTGACFQDTFAPCFVCSQCSAGNFLNLVAFICCGPADDVDSAFLGTPNHIAYHTQKASGVSVSIMAQAHGAKRHPGCVSRIHAHAKKAPTPQREAATTNNPQPHEQNETTFVEAQPAAARSWPCLHREFDHHVTSLHANGKAPRARTHEPIAAAPLHNATTQQDNK